MLTTYGRRKFRQYAPILFFLQLFAWLIYVGFFSANCSTTNDYAIHLQYNNRQNWERLESTISAFEYRISKERRGEEYLAGAKMFHNLAADYRARINVFSDEATWAVGVAFSDSSPEQKKKRLVKTANENNWKRQLQQIIQEYHAAFEMGMNFSGYVSDTADKRIIRSNIPSYIHLFNVSKSGSKFHTQDEVLTALEVADMIVINSAHSVIEHLFSKVSFGCMIYDKYSLIFNAESKVVYQGDSLKADVFLTKRTSMARPTIVVDGEFLPLDVDGVAQFKKTADKLGKHTIKASIFVKDGYGQDKIYTNVFEYTVVPRCE